MPTYDYQCTDCGKTYDVFHKVREVKDDVVCPECQSTKHVRLISAPSINMKGGTSTSRDVDSSPGCSDDSCCGGACGLN
jgi:putative FmdB family regulatory protein